MQGQNPTVQRRRLGAEFRRLREQAGKKLEEVAAYGGCAKSTMSRTESGRVGITPLLVRALLDFYRVSEQERDDLIAAAYESRKPNWWRPYAGVMTEPLHELLGLEAVTSLLKVFETSFMALLPWMWMSGVWCGRVPAWVGRTGVIWVRRLLHSSSWGRPCALQPY
ncbi:MAG: helix-turn-helix domain-containing protein [Pseudonocardiaceae bacterium]